jgi:excisionase family DNA binding protein
VPVNEACVYGRFARSKAFRMIREGKIKAYRDGGHRTLIDLNSIDEYYASLDQVILQGGRLV